MKQPVKVHSGQATSVAARLVFLCLLLCAVPAQAESADSFDQRFERIHQYNISGQLEKARQLLDHARVVLAQGRPEQQIEYRLLLAHNLGLRGQVDRALHELDQLHELELTDLQRMRALARSANLAATSRQHQRAFAYLREAVDLVDRVDHPLYQSDFLANLGQMLGTAGEIELAIAYGTRAVRLSDRSDDQRAQCVARQRLAASWAQAGQSQQLEEAIEDAMLSCEQAGDPVFLSALATQQGRVLLEAGQVDAAQAAALKSVALAEQAEFRMQLPLARLLLAQIDSVNGQSAQAAELALEQIQGLEERSLWEHLATAHELIARHYEAVGDFASALPHLEGLISARSQHIEQDRARRLGYLEIAYELDTREQEIALLREQALASALSDQAQQQQTRLRQLSYVAGAIVSALLVALLIRTRRERRYFQRLSQRDSLTRLLNHTHFFEEAQAALARNGANTPSLCLILADIDHFKKINDQFGHLVGDEVLKRVAARIRDCFPSPAILGRIGGEEFAIALPNCELNDAATRVHKLREQVNRTRSGEEATEITISFGLAAQANGEPLESLRRRADQALYQAKNEGRDRLVIASTAQGQ